MCASDSRACMSGTSVIRPSNCFCRGDQWKMFTSRWLSVNSSGAVSGTTTSSAGAPGRELGGTEAALSTFAVLLSRARVAHHGGTC
jgi:hypothetical protein